MIARISPSEINRAGLLYKYVGVVCIFALTPLIIKTKRLVYDQVQPAESLPASRVVACVPASTSCVNRIRDYCTIKNIPRRIIPEGGGDVLVALTPTCYIAMRIGIRRSHRPHLSSRSATLVSLFLIMRVSHSFSLSLCLSLSPSFSCMYRAKARVYVCAKSCAFARWPPRKSTPLHPAFDLSFSSFRLRAGDVAGRYPSQRPVIIIKTLRTAKRRDKYLESIRIVVEINRCGLTEMSAPRVEIVAQIKFK